MPAGGFPNAMSPTKPIRRCPRPIRCSAASRPPATSSMTVCGTPRAAAASTLANATPARVNWASCARDNGSEMASTPSALCVGSSASRCLSRSSGVSTLQTIVSYPCSCRTASALATRTTADGLVMWATSTATVRGVPRTRAAAA